MICSNDINDVSDIFIVQTLIEFSNKINDKRSSVLF